MMPRGSPPDDVRENPSLSRREYVCSIGVIGGFHGSSVLSDSVPATSTDVPARLLAVSVTHEWTTVEITESFSDPVVIAGPLSYNGYHRSHPRLREVSNTEFDVAVEEWTYLAGGHVEERTSCLVTDHGTYTLEDGTELLAGKVTADDERTSVSFPSSLATDPVVFSDIQTYNDSRPAVVRQQDVSKSGFAVRLQGSERRRAHETEDVGYVAIERGTGTLNDRAFEIDVESGVDHEWSTIEFDGTYREPLFVADLQTFSDPDSSGLRYRNLTESSVEIRVEEERSSDDEVVHAEEDVGYLVAGTPTSERTPTRSAEADGFGEEGFGADGFGV